MSIATRERSRQRRFAKIEAKRTEKRIRDNLRAELLMLQPACDRCGCNLQATEHRQADYACVCSELQLLFCLQCMPMVSKEITCGRLMEECGVFQ